MAQITLNQSSSENLNSSFTDRILTQIGKCRSSTNQYFPGNRPKMTFFRNRPKWHFEQFQILGNEEIVKMTFWKSRLPILG